MSVWVVIPLKSPQSAKSRLSSVLDGRQRLRLFYYLAKRVIEAAMNTPSVDAVTVATASDAVAAFATRLGAECLRLDGDHGTAAACSAALNSRRLPPRERVLFLPGDLPLVSSNALTQLVALSDLRPLVAIAGDRRKHGTNALLCSPGNTIPLCFGKDSFAKHLSAARRLGISTRIIDSPCLDLDIDEAVDLQEWQQRLVADGQPIDVELQDLFAVHDVAFSQ